MVVKEEEDEGSNVNVSVREEEDVSDDDCIIVSS